MIGAEDFTRKFEALVRGGVGPGLPRRVENRHVLLKAVTLGLDSRRTYSEPELGDALSEWLDCTRSRVDIDKVSLRRALVDYRYVQRDPAGRTYRVAFPAAVTFAADVDELDIRGLLASLTGSPRPE